MHHKNPVSDPLRRITFYPSDDCDWRFTQEWSADGGETWFEECRIKATLAD